MIECKYIYIYILYINMRVLIDVLLLVLLITGGPIDGGTRANFYSPDLSL